MADNIDYNKLADAIGKAIEKLSTGRSNFQQSRNGRGSSAEKNMKDFKDAIDEAISYVHNFSDAHEESIKQNSKLHKYTDETIDAYERLHKSLKSIKDGTVDQEKAIEKLSDNFSKAADQLGGSSKFLNDKAKDIAIALSKSSSSFASTFSDWNGTIKDMERQIQGYVDARKNSIELEQQLQKELNDLIVKREQGITAQVESAQKELNDLRLQHEKNLQDTSHNRDEYVKSTKDLIEAKEKEIEQIKSGAAELAAQTDFEIAITEDRIKAEIASIKQQTLLIESIAEASAEVLDSAKAANVFTKELDKAKSKVIDFATNAASISGGFKLLKDGAFEVAEKYRMIADSGMAGAMTEFAGTAIKLNVTIAQLSRIVGENRASFAKTGMSIQKFGAIAESNAASLKDIGLSNEQSAAAQAKMMGGAAAALGSDQKSNASLVKKSVDDQVKAFKMLSVATGESVDALAQQYESMLKDEDLSKQLQSMRGKERQDRAQEMLTDMAHYKLLGLSNEQIKNELKLKQASQFRLNDRYSGAAQMSVLGNLMGMNTGDTAKFNKLTSSGKKLDKDEQAFVDQYKSDLANKVNAEQQNNPNSGKNEAAQSLISGMGGYGKALMDSGQAIAGAQSKGDAQMSVADANKALIASQGQSTDKIVASYEKQSALIQNLMKQAVVSNDKMAIVGQKTENFKNMLDSFKDSPIWSVGKIILGAAGMFYAAARMFTKVPSIPELVGRYLYQH